jgi:hypothetical protein
MADAANADQDYILPLVRNRFGFLSSQREGSTDVRKSLVGCLLAVIATLSSGCVSTSAFTAVSSKNVNLSNIKLDRTKLKGYGKGEDCTPIIIFIPAGGPPTMKEAMDKAMESTGGNLLLDARVRYSFFWIPFVYGQACWTVEGDVYDSYQ